MTIDGVRTFNGWRIAGWGLVALLLLLPLVAMRYTREVHWTATDFVFAGVMLGGTGVLVELTVRASRNLKYRAGVGLLLAASFLLIWINGAVGIIGDEGNPLNLLYLGVIAIAAIGSLAARFRASGMAMATSAAAVAQGAMIAVAATYGSSEPPGMIGLVGINAFFVALFAAAAWLFHAAARDQG